MKRGDGALAARSRRFGLLSSFIAHPAARRIMRVFAWGFWTAYFLFVLLVLSLRYWVLPHAENYRPFIERTIGESLGQKVSIGRVEADWAGLYPELTLYEVSVADAGGRPALAFLRVDTVLSWWSVARMQLRLRLLRIEEPTLHMRRGSDGRLFIAGIPLGEGKGERGGERGEGGGIAPWALDQRRIRIDGATLVWEDELRGAPPLVMEDVNIAIDNESGRHRFGLTALPPKEFASRIDVRGDFTGGGFPNPDGWRGQAFAEIGYADLAIWKRWVDYPLVLPRGRGAARAWFSFAGGALRELTADVALRDVNLKFGENLPALELDSLSGRLRAGSPVDGLTLQGRGVALASRADGERRPIRIDPTDFEVEWRKDRESGKNIGSAGISRMNVEALARLAAHLPFDAGWRQLLADYAPRGRIDALKARWSGDAEKMDAYYLKTGVRGLGVRAKGYFPGFSGLTGTLEASENGGKALVESGESSIDLPAVFPESQTRFHSLSAEASWKIDRGGLEVELKRAEFASPEAAGSARGRYRMAGGGPGVIDLAAALERADARAVWRYLPHVVSRNARFWLRDSLLAGQAKARLTLKGDLADFPFLNKNSGQFLVTVEASDAVLDYGKGWPRIDDIAGNLRFEGSGMTIDARHGHILGARLTNTEVRIPDFDAREPILLVKGQADGPTAEFLKFIDQSPVAGTIDRFTEEMRATGDGRLDLDLAIPLDDEKLDKVKVAGTYRFTDNEVTVDAALPPLRGVNGSLRFSGNGLDVPEIRASLFGGPLKIRGGLQKDGRVLITADGVADIGALRRESDHPALAGLAGTTPYRGEIRIRGRDADLVVESELVGISSTLPEPFAKAADEVLPLYFEKRLLAKGDASAGAALRDRIDVSLGTRFQAQVIRKKASADFTPERGAIAIGVPLRLPEKGLALGVSLKRLDLDVWREFFDTALSREREGDDGASAWLPDTIDLQAGELLLHGLSWNDVDLSAKSAARGQWQIRVDSRQAAGDLAWDGANGGRLAAHFGRLAIERLPSESGGGAGETTAMTRLPALDVIADDFTVRQLRFGRLEVQANNDGALWDLTRIQASNPHGALSGKGSWRQNGGAGQTRLNFKLESNDVGGLLARMGYPGTVQAGTAQLAGDLAWNGSPVDFAYASLTGDIRLKAAKGQFLKLDPGAAGKLLGLISLQNLPRRISLDFKDVFSEGLAFNAITGKMAVQNGIMRTDGLRIDSPAARVSMRGEIDLALETQRLNVTVQPEIGDAAALGMAVVHPAVGVATWLTNKVLKNPLGAVFAYHYLIAGTWDDPKVEKLGTSVANEPPPEGSDKPGVFNESTAR